MCIYIYTCIWSMFICMYVDKIDFYILCARTSCVVFTYMHIYEFVHNDVRTYSHLYMLSFMHVGLLKKHFDT